MLPIQNETEQTLVMIKPHVYLSGDLEEAVGMLMDELCTCMISIKGSILITFHKEVMQEFYAEHQGKSFFDDVIVAGTEGPSFVFILEGAEAIKKIREIIGPTAGKQVGSLRYSFTTEMPRNGFHASDSPESFRRERDIVLKYMTALASKGLAV